MKKKTEALSGIRLKLKRAWHQVDTLKTDISSFLNSGPYTPAMNFNKETKRLTLKVHVERFPDPMWSVRVGEIIHNFRSALDHAIWELAGHPSGRTSKTQFPIFEHESGFADRGMKQYLKNIKSVSAIRLIESEQPFFIREDGTAEGTMHSPLWHLKELSDIDKHRFIHLTGTTLASHKFSFAPVAQPFTVVGLQEHPGGPIQEDTILWTGVLRGATNWPFEKPDVKGAFEVEIAFEDGTPAPGVWAVRGTLANIGNRTERILRRIAEDWKTEL